MSLDPFAWPPLGGEFARKPLIFGGAPIGGLYEPVSAAAAATLGAEWQAGVRAFDTAPHYGAGLSEKRLGEFLAGRPRAEFVVSTKVGRRLVPASGSTEGVEGLYGTPSLSRMRDYTRDGVRASKTACGASDWTGWTLRSSMTLMTSWSRRLIPRTRPWPNCALTAWSERSASG